MKKKWGAYKKMILFRVQSESLRNASRKMDADLYQYLEDSSRYDIEKNKQRILVLVEEFLQYINTYEIFLLHYTYRNPERIRKLLWQCKYETFEEQYSVVDNINRFMQSIEDGNILLGLGKRELIFIALLIIIFEIGIYLIFHF